MMAANVANWNYGWPLYSYQDAAQKSKGITVQICQPQFVSSNLVFVKKLLVEKKKKKFLTFFLPLVPKDILIKSRVIIFVYG